MVLKLLQHQLILRIYRRTTEYHIYDGNQQGSKRNHQQIFLPREKQVKNLIKPLNVTTSFRISVDREVYQATKGSQSAKIKMWEIIQDK